MRRWAAGGGGVGLYPPPTPLAVVVLCSLRAAPGGEAGREGEMGSRWAPAALCP